MFPATFLHDFANNCFFLFYTNLSSLNLIFLIYFQIEYGSGYGCSLTAALRDLSRRVKILRPSYAHLAQYYYRRIWQNPFSQNWRIWRDEIFTPKGTFRAIGAIKICAR